MKKKIFYTFKASEFPDEILLDFEVFLGYCGNNDSIIEFNMKDETEYEIEEKIRQYFKDNGISRKDKILIYMNK